MRGFYFITDSRLTKQGIEHDLAMAVDCDCAMIQYRSTQSSERLLFEEASRLRQLAQHIPFIINDRLDIALAVGAAGVHLGQTDLPVAVARRILGPTAIIGVSVANLEQAQAALAAGASYLAISPVYSTTTKTDAGPGRGIATLRAVRRLTDRPIAVIGGITLERARECVAAGADLVCAISATLQQPKLDYAIHQFKEIFDDQTRTSPSRPN